MALIFSVSPIFPMRVSARNRLKPPGLRRGDESRAAPKSHKSTDRSPLRRLSDRDRWVWNSNSSVATEAAYTKPSHTDPSTDSSRRPTRSASVRVPLRSGATATTPPLKSAAQRGVCGASQSAPTSRKRRCWESRRRCRNTPKSIARWCRMRPCALSVRFTPSSGG
jgi:hypothetical protein